MSRLGPCRPTRRVSGLIPGLALLAALATPALAQLPNARLHTIFPPGAKQGAAIDVAVAGTDLDETHALHFSHAGITATQKTHAPSEFHDKPRPIAGQFTLEVAGDVPPGIYEVRAVGLYGISSPRVFVVSDRTELVEKSPNNKPADAMAVPLGVIVNGQTNADAIDCYKITAKKGQRVIVDGWAQRIDSRADLTLVAFDPAGNELDRARDSNRRDPLLDFTALADGDYVVTAYDFLYRGGAEYFYRLTISAGPYVDYVFPPAGQPGTKAKYTVYGRGLPGGQPAEGVSIDGKPLEQVSVEITLPDAASASRMRPVDAFVEPYEAVLPGIDYRLPSPTGFSNPVRLGFATAPVVAETEPNDDPAHAQEVTVPCEVVGQFDPLRDQDWIRFQAKKGDVYWVEVFSQRLGLPTDPFLRIQRVTKNDKGEEQVSDIKEVDDSSANVGGKSYNTASKDPNYRFAVPDDGTYRIVVRDLFGGSRAGPAHLYRLSIRKAQPDFSLLAVVQKPNEANNNATVWTALLRKGGTTAIQVLALRRDGFGGDIQLTAEGLPAGVTCAPATLSARANEATLVLVAADNAAGWAGPIRIIGKATIGDAEVAREALGGSLTWTVGDTTREPTQARLTRNIVLAVSEREAAPVLIQAGDGKPLETSLAGKVEIPVTVTRRGDFAAALKIRAVGIPGLKKSAELSLDPKTGQGTLALEFTNKDGNKFEPGQYTFTLEAAEAEFKYRRNPEAAAAAEAERKAIEKIAADRRAAAQGAAEAKAALDKAATDAQAQVKAATDAKAAAEKALAGAEAAVRTTAQAKTVAVAAAAQATAQAKASTDAKSAADKSAATAQAEFETAVEARTAAEKAAAAAEAKAKSAQAAKADADQAAAAAQAKAKTANDAKAVAEKAATDAANQRKAAAAARIAQAKAVAAAQIRGQAAAQAKTAVEKPAAEFDAKAKAAEAERDAATKRAKEAGDRAKPKDVKVVFRSTPLTVKLTPAPITLAVSAAGPLAQGATIELPVTIERLYGFAEPVEVSVEVPKSAKGLEAANVTIAKSATQAKLVFEAAKDAAAGEHKVTVRAKLKLNGQDLQVTQSVSVTVTAVEKKDEK